MVGGVVDTFQSLHWNTPAGLQTVELLGGEGRGRCGLAQCGRKFSGQRYNNNKDRPGTVNEAALNRSHDEISGGVRGICLLGHTFHVLDAS